MNGSNFLLYTFSKATINSSPYVYDRSGISTLKYIKVRYIWVKIFMDGWCNTDWGALIITPFVLVSYSENAVISENHDNLEQEEVLASV